MYQMAAEFSYNHQESFAIGVVAIVMLLLSVVDRRGRKAWQLFFRGKEMTKEEYEARNNQIQSDAIYDTLMRLVEDGEQTEHAVQKTLRRLSNWLQHREFIKKELAQYEGFTPEELDLIESIQRSRYQLYRSIRSRKKVAIPGPKPGEGLVVAPPPIPPWEEEPKASSFGGSLLK